MSTTRRGTKFAALALSLALVAAACGDDDDATSDTAATPTTSGSTTADTTESSAATDTTAESTDTTTAGTTDDTTDTTTEGTGGTGGEAGEMTVTYTLSDAAVWNDGTPISAADFECTANAVVNTPGSITTVGYDLITSVEEGASDKEVVVTFSQPFAAWKTLFSGTGFLKSDEYEDCNDVSEAFATGAFTYGAGPYLMTSWSAEQVVYEKNPGYKGENTGGPERVVFVPAEDGPTLLKSGTVDFIYPQAYTGIDAELSDPNVAFDAEPGGQFEALYFMQDDACTPDDTRSCAFADDDFRAAFSKSIDLQGVYEQIYAPFAQGLPLLECGPIAPGPYCDPVFTETYDPAGAEQILTDAGWTKNGEGMWANADGEVPEVRWLVNTGNTRRESTQEYLIPKLAEAGFNVVADNCEAIPCMFQTRIPAEQYDFTMYISTVAPDPIYITGSYVCDQIPSEENDFQGQNNVGWCNEEATEALKQADLTLDEDERSDAGEVRDRSDEGRLRHPADAAVPEHRRLPHRQGRWDAEQPGQLLGVQRLVELRGPRRRRPSRHRGRAVPGAGLHQPDHRVRELVVVPVGRRLPELPRDVLDHQRADLRAERVPRRRGRGLGGLTPTVAT